MPPTLITYVSDTSLSSSSRGGWWCDAAVMRADVHSFASPWLLLVLVVVLYQSVSCRNTILISAPQNLWILCGIRFIFLKEVQATHTTILARVPPLVSRIMSLRVAFSRACMSSIQPTVVQHNIVLSNTLVPKIITSHIIMTRNMASQKVGI